MKKQKVGLWSAVAMGIGAMVGAGIFALLGEAGSISGSAVYISFILGGVIALFSGYSMGKLGARYPSAGGIIEYLSQAYGVGPFVGSMGIMLFLAAVVSLSLIAKAFGNYAVTFLPLNDQNDFFRSAFSVGIVLIFVVINLRGPKDVALWERITVAIKFTVLVFLAIAGFYSVDVELLAPVHYPKYQNIFFSLAITFFAYEGFRVISNMAEDMDEPESTLPKAMAIAIIAVMVLYVAISLAVFGNMPLDKVLAAKEYALAEVARPEFGEIGFLVVAFTALVATASAINANLYAVTNITYKLAKDGELPAPFGKPLGHSREGLVISGVFVIILSLLFDLSDIAAIGSICILFIHAVTHLGHLRLLNETKASRLVVVLALLFSVIAMLLSLIYIVKTAPHIVFVLIAFVAVSVVTEVVLQRVLKREIQPRIKRQMT